MEFVHIHTHSGYSLLDGACRIPDMVSRAKENGQKALAITDHGVMYGAVEFYKECKKQGIKPIIGCEVSVAPQSRFDKSGSEAAINESAYTHLILLCKDQEGYKNLCRLVSLGWTEGFYRKPRVDKESLRKYAKGLICTSACIAGSIPKAILNGDISKARAEIEFYKTTFEDFYIEIQNHGLADELKVLPVLVQLAREHNVPLVCANDAHYVVREDADIQDTMLCIQTESLKSAPNRFKFEGTEFYLKTTEEMYDLFKDYPEALSNTVEIANKCNFDFEFGKIHLPYYEIPVEFNSHYDYLRWLTTEGMKKRYGSNIPKEYTNRMEYELSIINKMGFVSYYLSVWDFINWAKTHGIPVGPGRGSGAGSIVAYAIGITNLDPMRFNLLFERFLNPERVSMPDFDVDFCFDRRHEVIDYVTEKYGKDRVSQIVTFGTMAAKRAVLDVAKVMGIPTSEAMALSKLIPDGAHMTIDQALEISKDFKKAYDSNPNYKTIIDMARGVEGMPRHTSTHAAGVLIADAPITEYAPLIVDKNGSAVIQFPMTILEDIGLIKMDFLGLRTLTVINNACKSIAKKDPSFNIESISLDDEETYKMLSRGDSAGVFQFESSGMKSTLIGLQPSSMEDLTAVISLYRPGPMDSIPTFIHNKHNPDNIIYADEKLKPILSVTYGVLVYQEQVQQIFRDLAGFSLGRADIVRRAMGKKKLKIMEEEKQHFIYGMKDENGNTIIEGALARGVSQKVCDDLMDSMTAFASYAFNKSHAAAYAYVAYLTAYLRCHFPVEFMAALLTSVTDDPKALGEYCSVVRQELKIPMLPLDINQSEYNFTAENGCIRFGFSGLSDTGEDISRAIISERNKNGKFTSMVDFVRRVKLSGAKLTSGNLTAIVNSGAFDSFGYTRAAMVAYIPKALDYCKNIYSIYNSSRFNLLSLLDEAYISQAFPCEEIENIPEYSKWDLLFNEKKACKVFFSGHPLQDFSGSLSSFSCLTKIGDIVNESDSGRFTDGMEVVIAGLGYNIVRKATKRKTPMIDSVIEDQTGCIKALAFEKFINTYGTQYEEKGVYVVVGNLKISDGDVTLFINRIVPISKDNTLYLSELNKIQKKYDKANITINEKAAKIQHKSCILKIQFESKEQEQIDKIGTLLKENPGTANAFVSFAEEPDKYYKYQFPVAVSNKLITAINSMAGCTCAVISK